MARPGLESSGRRPRSRHGCPHDPAAETHPTATQSDGETRTRTGDTTIFSRVLYQLSYLADSWAMLAAPPRSGESREASKLATEFVSGRRLWWPMSRGWDEGSPALGTEPWRELAPRADWADLVLPEELITRLREVPELYRHRPRAGGKTSLLLLFGGPSGVGKTSAALALAAELGRPVLESDVDELIARDRAHAPQLVTRLINHARQLGGVLVLDHADTLLRSRREVGVPDLSERAAVPLLRLDREGARLPGIVIFCAELAHDDPHIPLHFDHTFVFPALDARARALIWERHLPAGHLIPNGEIAYLAQAFRLSGKAIAECCAVAERRTAGRAVSLHDIADRLDAEYENRLASDWTRAALAEVRVRAARLGLEDTTRPMHSSSPWSPPAPRPAPVRERDPARRVPARGTDSHPAPRARPRRPPPPRVLDLEPARRPRRDWLTMLGVVLTGAIAAVALGIALAPHPKAQPTAVNSPSIPGPTATLIGYRSRLARALNVLNRERATLSRELTAARTPSAQAKAAYALANAHLHAASTLLTLDAGPAGAANQQLVSALQAAGNAYSSLAKAAQGHDRTTYAGARQAVSAANGSVSAAIVKVRSIAD
jgi:hypothetical protein